MFKIEPIQLRASLERSAQCTQTMMADRQLTDIPVLGVVAWLLSSKKFEFLHTVVKLYRPLQQNKAMPPLPPKLMSWGV